MKTIAQIPVIDTIPQPSDESNSTKYSIFIAHAKLVITMKSSVTVAEAKPIIDQLEFKDFEHPLIEKFAIHEITPIKN